MKYISASILIIFWFIATIILVCSFIGCVIFILYDEWIEIPFKLLKVFELDK